MTSASVGNLKTISSLHCVSRTWMLWWKFPRNLNLSRSIVFQLTLLDKPMRLQLYSPLRERSGRVWLYLDRAFYNNSTPAFYHKFRCWSLLSLSNTKSTERTPDLGKVSVQISLFDNFHGFHFVLHVSLQYSSLKVELSKLLTFPSVGKEAFVRLTLIRLFRIHLVTLCSWSSNLLVR